ncbi:MAG: hypothetical protein C4290_03500 [Chloroflexota bacterium]
MIQTPGVIEGNGTGASGAPREETTAAVASDGPVPRGEDVSLDAVRALESGIRFPPYQPYRGSQDLLRASALVAEHPAVLAELVRQVVEVEAPLHLEQLYDRVRGLYGHMRAGRRIREALSQAVQQATRRGWVKMEGNFLWRAGQVPTSVKPRGPGEVARPPEHICPEEWEAAVVEVLRQLGATKKSQVAQEIVRAVLGHSRSGLAREYVMQIMERLLAKGELLELDGVLHVRPQRN